MYFFLMALPVLESLRRPCSLHYDWISQGMHVKDASTLWDITTGHPDDEQIIRFRVRKVCFCVCIFMCVCVCVCVVCVRARVVFVCVSVWCVCVRVCVCG